jgi:hypothetical protein
VSGEEISLKTLFEDRSNIAFDLTHPELISPNALAYDDENHLNRDDIATFSQVLELAVQGGVDVGLIIPVMRYFNGQDFLDPDSLQLAKDTAREDISTFLQRLKEGAYNHGIYPDLIIFEIGNELYSNPIEYALIAKVMIDEIGIQLGETTISYEIAFQISRGFTDFNNLDKKEYFDRFFDQEGSLLEELSGLSFNPTAELSKQEKQTAIDKIMVEILGDSLLEIDAVRQHYLKFDLDMLDKPQWAFWSRSDVFDFWEEAIVDAGGNADDLSYYISAWSTDSSNGTREPYGLAAAANNLEMFAHFMDIGVDRAALWGVIASFKYDDEMHDTVVSDRLSDFLSPSATILKLMTENIKDNVYLGKIGGLGDDFHGYLFEDADGYTAFFSVEKLWGSEFQLEVQLGLFSDVASVSVMNLDSADGSGSGETRLLNQIVRVNDGSIMVNFDQDFEVVMITFEKESSDSYQLARFLDAFKNGTFDSTVDVNNIRGTNSDDHLIGTKFSDYILGEDGDDVIYGGGGRSDLRKGDFFTEGFDGFGRLNGDAMFGGAGDDLIYGMAGNDLLSGGLGNDELRGGSGFDTFVFNSGVDRINDFQIGIDKIQLDPSLLGGIELERWLTDNLEVTDDGAKADFGNGNQLLIIGEFDFANLIKRSNFLLLEDADYLL